jgi:twitching motility two-component system response regulator PilG
MDRLKRVALVDDDQGTVKLFSYVLRALGHEVQAFEEPASAASEIFRYEPDVVLLDLYMPEPNGFDIAATLRNLGYQGLLVAVTGMNMLEDGIKCREVGFNQRWLKPVLPSHFSSMLAGEPCPAATQQDGWLQ